jgi:hypothetical protein
MRIKELKQQWEPAEALGQLSHQWLLRLVHHLADALAFKRSIGNEARMILAVAEDPRLSDWTVWQRFSQQAGQAPTTP